MFRRNPIYKKLVAGIALALALVLGQVAGAGLASADGHDHHHGRASTTTDLKVFDHFACAFVSAKHGTPTGTVTFKVTDHKTSSATVPLRHGKACVGLRLHPGKYTLTATYNGDRHFKPSSDSVSIKVTGRDRHEDRFDHHSEEHHWSD